MSSARDLCGVDGVGTLGLPLRLPPGHLRRVLLPALQDAFVLLLALVQQLPLQPVLQLPHARARALEALARRGPGGLLAEQSPAEATRGQALSPRPPAPARAAEGRAAPPPLPLLAGALARAQLAAPAAAPRARRPESSQLRQAPLQELLPAPRAAPLQIPQLLLVPPLQLHDALQLPQLLWAGGPRLCGGWGEARRHPAAP